jgi:N-methylhydantoinase B
LVKDKQEKKSSGIVSEIIRSHLSSAAEEMRRSLIRTAFNPVIYDVLDFGISIYDDNLDLIVEAPGIPSFIGANDYAIKKAIEYVGRDDLNSGDIFFMNYPYWSSAHTYDATLFAPVFSEEKNRKELVAFEVIRAHWMDLGAKDSGYVLDSTSMHQEGIVFPGTRLYKKGKPNRDILEIMRFNSRMPDAIMGDLNAQVSSIRTGERRIHQILRKFGLPSVKQTIATLLKSGERHSLDALAKLPHGTWSAEDFLDGDGISDELIPMKATVSISSTEFKVDFTGSAGQAKGPVNMPFGATTSLCKIVFKSLTTPKLPSNSGNYRPLKVEAPPGTLFHAIYPAPTFTLWTGIVALELVYKAVAQGLEEYISASSGGDLPGFMMVGKHPDTGRFYALSNNETIGWGAAPDHDGANAMQHHSVATGRNTPIEVLEIRTGMMIDRLELRQDSGGAGKFRGGLGVQRDIHFVAEGEFLSVMKKSKTKPWGLAGGMETEPNGLYIFRGTPAEKRVGTFRFPARIGEKCALVTAGGGGYGNPLERDPKAVLEDVLDGYVSTECAKSLYGVCIIDGKSIDFEETNRLRSIKKMKN